MFAPDGWFLGGGPAGAPQAVANADPRPPRTAESSLDSCDGSCIRRTRAAEFHSNPSDLHEEQTNEEYRDRCLRHDREALVVRGALKENALANLYRFSAFQTTRLHSRLALSPLSRPRLEAAPGCAAVNDEGAASAGAYGVAALHSPDQTASCAGGIEEPLSGTAERGCFHALRDRSRRAGPEATATANSSP